MIRTKFFSFLLALSLTLWAHANLQTAPAAQSSQSQGTQAEAACACCDKAMAGDHKDMGACCHDMAGKSCCSGMKEGASCKRSDKENAAAGKDCCKGKTGCMGKDKKAAMKCCGDHCERHKGASSAM